MNTPSPRRFRAFFWLAAVTVFRLTTVAAEDRPVASGPSLTVQPGDSWVSIRARMFPLDALHKANPDLSPEVLHPGEVVRAPYVPVAELDRAREARQAAEQRMDEMKKKLVAFEADRASFEARRRELSRAEAAQFVTRAVMIALIVVTVALVAALAFFSRELRAARRKATEATTRYSALESRYRGLRESLREIDQGVQRRVVSLLKIHGGKIVRESEVSTSVEQMLDATRELKKRHESA